MGDLARFIQMARTEYSPTKQITEWKMPGTQDGQPVRGPDLAGWRCRALLDDVYQPMR